MARSADNRDHDAPLTRGEFERELGAVKADVREVKTEVSWLKWGLIALVATLLMPKIGGPDAAKVAQHAAQHGVHYLIASVRP